MTPPSPPTYALFVVPLAALAFVCSLVYELALFALDEDGALGRWVHKRRSYRRAMKRRLKLPA